MLSAHGLKSTDVCITGYAFLLGDRFRYQFVKYSWIAVSADGTVLLKALSSLQCFFEVLATDDKVVRALVNLEWFSAIQFGQHQPAIYHALAGQANNVELLALDLVFKDLQHNVA